MENNFNFIDEMARKALDNFEVEFNPEDWKDMERRLDKKEHLMPHIWFFKGVEALVLVLVLFTAFNLMCQYSDTQELGSFNQEELISDNFNTSTHEKTSTQTQHNLNAVKKEQSQLLSNSFWMLPNLKSGSSALAKGQASAQLPLKKQGATILPPNKGMQKELFPNASPKDNNLALLHSTSKDKSEVKSTDLIKTEEELQTGLSTREIAPIDLSDKTIEDGNGGGDGDPNKKEFGIESKFKLPKIFTHRLRLAIVASPDINLATSMGRTNVGLSFGAFVETDICPSFSVRSGLIASRKNYEADFVQMIDRTATEGVIYKSVVNQTIRNSIVQIPVLISYTPIKDAKWKLSVSAGASANIVTNRFASGTQRTAVSQQAGAIVVVSDINPNSAEKGTLQSGNFKNNSYFNAIVGFGLERQLGDRVSLFIQPNYQHALTPVGQGQDKLHQFSLYSGVKMILK